MLKKLLFVAFTCVFIKAHSANDNLPMGARAVGLGNASAANEDVWAVYNNIAGVARLSHPSAAAFFERRYNFSAFDRVGIAANVPTALNSAKYGNTGITLSRVGNDLYNEMRMGAGYAHNIMNVNLGIQAEYVQVAVSELGSKGNLIINFGGQAAVSKMLRFGAHIYNINQAKINAYQDERIPTIMKFGISLTPVPQLAVNAEMEKDVMLPPRFKGGLEYGILYHENYKVFLRTGINVNPEKYFFGVEFQNKITQIGYSVAIHQQLGWVHAFSVGFSFLTKKRVAASE